MSFDPTNVNNPYDENDLSALNGSCAGLVAMAQPSDLRLDAADNPGIFFAQQLAYIKSKAYDKQYPELKGLSLFPMTSDVDEGANTIEYYSYEQFGQADIISNYGEDLARVDVKGVPHRANIVSIGDSYGYNTAELRAARRNAMVLKNPKPLDAARAEAARRAYDVRVNHLIWNGDEKTGIVGILSANNNIPVYTLPAGESGAYDWDSKTVDEIAADVAGMLNYINVTTRGIERPDSWVMPESVYTSLSLRRVPDTGVSFLTYLKENVKQIKNWEYASELNASNTDYNSTGKNIGLLYTKDSEKLSHEAPMPFKQYPAQQRNLEIVINCEGRDAGMVIYYPYSACLVYGL